MDLFTRVVELALYSACVTTALLVLWYWRPALLLAPVKVLTSLAKRRAGLCILVLGMIAPAIRLAEAPWLGIPDPRIQDEFVNLLMADTLARGRLANPSHPFREHFESTYVLQQPSYAASYPPGNGMLLAAGRLIGHPWLGVCLGIGLMCSTIAWMLYAWVPPFWAVVGALLVIFRLGISSYWVNSYWGGPVAAIGGALAIGALPRLFKQPVSWKYPVLLAAGWSIVWLTRPFEAVFFGLGITLLILLMGRRERWPIRNIMRQIAIPAGPMILACISFSAYYNWRVTNNIFVMPYQLSQQVYGVPQGFYLQEELPPPKVRYKNMIDVYRWQLDLRRTSHTLSRYFERLGRDLYWIWVFYVGGLYTIPFLITLCGLRQDSAARLMTGLCATGLVSCSLYAFLFPHYLAPYTAAAVFMVVYGLQVMSKWHIGRFPVGAFLAVILVARVSWRSALPMPFEGNSLPSRAKIEMQLLGIPGKHLVFVRYGPHHDFHMEWLYNDADIDSAAIVWAREVDPLSDGSLVTYFKDRAVWLLNTDASPPRLQPYRPDFANTSRSSEHATQLIAR